MTRRGRPRKPGPSEPNGQLQRKARRDTGTREIKSLREWYAGDGDPVLTTYPLGILLANSAIGEDQHRAGCQYAWLHWRVFGRPSVAAARFEFMDRTTGTDRDCKSCERKLKAVYEELRRHPARYRHALDGVVIYERMPRWMRPVMPRPSDVAEAGALLAALGLLVARCSWALSEAA